MSTSVDDETILEVLRSNDAPRMTTTEVAGHLPVTRGTTRTRLQRLVDDDLLKREREGNNVVWWLPDREDELAAWEAEQEEGDAEEAADEVDDEAAETEESGADPGETTDDDATTVEVEATERVSTDESPADDATTVEVEAVDEGEDEGEDEEAETATRETPTEPSPTAQQRATLSDDEEGLRALALLAAVLAVLLLLRKLLGVEADDETDGETE